MSTGSQEVLMQGLYAASKSELSSLVSPSFDAVQLFCLLGVTISIAVILQLDVDGLSWILSNIE
jgi:hypothetical protein